MNRLKLISCFLVFCVCFNFTAQEKTESNSGMFSLGVRSTANLFSDDGFGLGTGGQFRIQFAKQINTDWFADYIVINEDNLVRSEYYHIGWSVLFYPFFNKEFNKKVTPYFLAGHCFDYNRKVEIGESSNSMNRWGSAVQTGLGVHFNLTTRMDVSFTSQYMIHMTKEIGYLTNGSSVTFVRNNGEALEGHLLTTLSFNYKIGKLWGRR